MNIGFAGFRHYHILGLYNAALANPDVNILACYEENEATREELGKSHNIETVQLPHSRNTVRCGIIITAG